VRVRVCACVCVLPGYATLSILTGQDATDPKAAAAGPAWPGGPPLPPPDSLNMWPMLSGANTTSPRDTLVLRGIATVPGEDGKDSEGAIIRTLLLPRAATPSRMKLVTGAQGGYWGGQYAPNSTAAHKLPPCGAGCLFNLDLGQLPEIVILPMRCVVAAPQPLSQPASPPHPGVHAPRWCRRPNRAR
jgi:hypothetical protein